MRPGGRAAAAVGLALLLGGVAAAAWSPAFDSYDSDLWTYVLIVERVAEGRDMTRLEPFRLEPPASPQVTAPWLALGYLKRATGLSGLALARALAVVTIGLLAFGVWRLSEALLGASLCPAALAAFFVALPESWAALGLGRYLSLAFVLLAAASATRLGRGGRAAVVATAVFVSLAFYAHLFGGVLAAGAVLLVALARVRQGHAPPLRGLMGALALGGLLSLPCLALAAGTLGREATSAHVWRPEQVDFLGLRWMAPGEALRLVPGAVLVLSLVGLVAPAPPERMLAREVARVGTIATLLVLLTPLYHFGILLFGAWMPGRVVVLAFPWLGAVLGLAFLVSAARPSVVRIAGAALAVLAVCSGATRAAADWTDRTYAFTPAAQAEAMGLRERMREATYVAPDSLGYGLAGPTLGRPLAVPPGHASPFGDFRRQQRRVHRAFLVNTGSCWSALLALYPDARFLVTPAPGAEVERGIWRQLFPAVPPEAVRERLTALGVLREVAAGPRFVVDELWAPPSVAASGPGHPRTAGTEMACRGES